MTLRAADSIATGAAVQTGFNSSTCTWPSTLYSKLFNSFAMHECADTPMRSGANAGRHSVAWRPFFDSPPNHTMTSPHTWYRPQKTNGGCVFCFILRSFLVVRKTSWRSAQPASSRRPRGNARHPPGLLPFGVAIPLGHCMVKIVDRDSVLLHHFFGRSIVNEFVAFGIMRGIRRDRGGGGPDDLGAIPFQQGHNPCQILGILIDRVVPCPGTAAKDVVQSSDQS